MTSTKMSVKFFVCECFLLFTITSIHPCPYQILASLIWNESPISDHALHHLSWVLHSPDKVPPIIHTARNSITLNSWHILQVYINYITRHDCRSVPASIPFFYNSMASLNTTNQETRSKKQEARRKHEARSKRQEARSKMQEARTRYWPKVKYVQQSSLCHNTWNIPTISDGMSFLLTQCGSALNSPLQMCGIQFQKDAVFWGKVSIIACKHAVPTSRHKKQLGIQTETIFLFHLSINSLTCQMQSTNHCSLKVASNPHFAIILLKLYCGKFAFLKNLLWTSTHSLKNSTQFPSKFTFQEREQSPF